MTGLTNFSVPEWQTQWMQHMGDILLHIMEQTGWPTVAPLSKMFERFPPPGKEGVYDKDDDDKDTLYRAVRL
ncbi:hypothetical protein J1N35_014011 [Gossypium stocksii]|uniref:Uncharacterized protein n=1 Tax=Gossypium stocksii TaxID=47602 RepID=A0A9D3VTE7_9ROSI|nr:hypothetical protein J1N35_014011 [Gossypium stocksii]